MTYRTSWKPGAFTPNQHADYPTEAEADAHAMRLTVQGCRDVVVWEIADEEAP
jgi:hypothetical protein